MKHDPIHECMLLCAHKANAQYDQTLHAEPNTSTIAHECNTIHVLRWESSCGLIQLTNNTGQISTIDSISRTRCTWTARLQTFGTLKMEASIRLVLKVARL